MSFVRILIMTIAIFTFTISTMAAEKIGVIYDAGWVFNQKTFSTQKYFFDKYDKIFSSYVKKNPKLFGGTVMVESSAKSMDVALSYVRTNGIKADAKAPIKTREAQYAYWKTFDIDDIVNICKTQQWQGVIYLNFSNGFNYKPNEWVDLVGCVFYAAYIDAQNRKCKYILPGASQLVINNPQKDKERALYNSNYVFLVQTVIENLQSAPSYAELIINCNAGNRWINNPQNRETFVNYHHLKGVILNNYGAYEDALMESNVILDVVPNRREAYNLRWQIYERTGDNVKAKENKDMFYKITKELANKKK